MGLLGKFNQCVRVFLSELYFYLHLFIECNCHGHSEECEYNSEVEERKLSLDINGNYEGGGVCKKCDHNTHGINCENCKPFFYRPAGVDITDPNACQRMIVFA